MKIGTSERMEHQRKILRVLEAVLVGIVVLTIVLTMVYLVVISSKIDASNAYLVDCTTPTGSCYKNASKAQSGAVQNINLVTTAATVCAIDDANDTFTEMQKCISTIIKKEGK